MKRAKEIFPHAILGTRATGSSALVHNMVHVNSPSPGYARMEMKTCVSVLRVNCNEL